MVDIIIPVYNALDTLELAVTSALMQGDVRILLVDDGSTDGTARLCDELAHHPRIAVIHQQNRGVSAARNAGLQAAASEWLTFLMRMTCCCPTQSAICLPLRGIRKRFRACDPFGSVKCAGMHRSNPLFA